MNINDISNIKYEKLFSICSLVTNLEEYKEMVESFNDAGFTDQNTEFLYINNIQKNQYDGYSGVNHFLNNAKGKYIILCHQDILLKYDNLEVLLDKIDEVDNIDKDWAILANCGFKDFNKVSLRITDPLGENRNYGPFPGLVKSVDENFILVKNDANLSLSNNINGFHFYGTDLCLIAKTLGYNAYVIDFHIYHKSAGTVNKNFYDNKKRFISKYEMVLGTKMIRTPVTPLILTSNKFLNWLLNRKLFYSIKKRYDYILKRLSI